ncbi:hypothetical protein RAHE111665_09455 [Rariglobus hedericola]
MRRTRRIQTIGFVVLVGVVCVLWISVSALSYYSGKALQVSGEGNFWTVLVMGVTSWILGITICVFGFGVTVTRWLKTRSFSGAHFFGALVVVAILCVRHNFYMQGIRDGLMPIDEVAYVSFAHQTRALFGSEIQGSIILAAAQDTSAFDSTDAARARAFSKLLKDSVLSRWPQAYASIRVDDDSVWLERGGGFHRIGIQIFDRESYTGDNSAVREPEDTYYMPTELGLSKRVVFTSGD